MRRPIRRQGRSQRRWPTLIEQVRRQEIMVEWSRHSRKPPRSLRNLMCVRPGARSLGFSLKYRYAIVHTSKRHI